MQDTTEPTPRKTALYDCHLAAGGKIVDFAGWQMPVQYAGIMPEHTAVRTNVGMFDISHMGQVRVRGPQAWLDGLLTNSLAKLRPGHGQYTLMLNENGGVIDDLIIYQTAETEWFLVINASKREEDIAWLRKHQTDEISVEDLSDAMAGLAIQGPNAGELFEKWAGQALPPRNGIVELVIDTVPCTICRTGYTGEDGYELFCPAEQAAAVWQTLLAQGITPCGLGARDSLRLEMGYPLNGQDLTATRTPVEAGLGFFVDFTKSFTGSDHLKAQKASGGHDKLVGFLMIGKTPPPRAHLPVQHGGAVVGETTSGGFSPSLGQGIGMAYVPASLAALGTEILIDIRGRLFPAQVVKRPFWKPAPKA